MNHDLRRAVRDATARTLLAASRVLARLAARMVGHPSARQERVVQRVPWLHVVTNHAAEADAVRSERETTALRRDAR